MANWWLGLLFVASAAAGASKQAAPHTIGDTQQAIEEIISSNKIVIFSHSTCKESAKVKELFEDYGASYASYELDERLDGKAMAKTLGLPKFQPNVNSLVKTFKGSSVVPAIFVRGQPVRFETLQISHKSGELEHWIDMS